MKDRRRQFTGRTGLLDLPDQLRTDRGRQHCVAFAAELSRIGKHGRDQAEPGTFDRVELIKDFASYLNANRGGGLPGREKGTGTTAEPEPERPSWRVGDRALAASGWSGTISSLDADKGRATLDVNGGLLMR